MARFRIYKLILDQNFRNSPILTKNVTQYQLTVCQCMSTVKQAKIDKNRKLTSHFEHEENVNISETNKEKIFLVRAKQDPDIFGSPPEKEVLDEGDIQEEKFFTEQPAPSRKLSTKKYADIIKDLIQKRKIKEAIDVVEIKMLKEDRVKPENYIYNLLLGACGRVGYTKKAFMLYNQMKKRGLKVTPGTYTALFNACANSPWPETDGLTRAKHLLEIIYEKQYEPNDTNYNAMIKAFGRCGDLPTAFTLVDEMTSRGLPIKDDTINFLLQACISDKEAGFRHALLVWRKLIDKRIQPSVYTYNLMLRSIRDCGLGDVEVAKDVINRLLPNRDLLLDQNNTKLLESDDGKQKLVESECSENDKIGSNNDKFTTELVENKAVLNNNPIVEHNFRPNLMADVPHLGNIISLNEVTRAEDRFLLVGGCKNFLENMKNHKCTPDVKTFTQLLDVIPSTLVAEKELIVAMKKLNVKADLDFYNMLIKKRSMRFDYESAREVLQIMDRIGYKPDLITFGILALGCKTKEEANQLIELMKSKAYRLNPEILGAMLQQACFHWNFGYVLEVMEICSREEINPNKKFMVHLEKFKNKCKEKSNEQKLSKAQEKGWMVFKLRYKTWIQEMRVEDPEDEHPWQQFREENKNDAKHLINKDTARFKPRHISQFKVKTSTKHMNNDRSKFKK